MLWYFALIRFGLEAGFQHRRITIRDLYAQNESSSGKTIFCCAPGAALRCPWGWLDVSVTLQDVVLSNQRNKCSLRFKDKYLRVTLMRRKVKRGFQLERPSTTRRSAVLTRIGHKSEPPTVTPQSCQGLIHYWVWFWLVLVYRDFW